MTRTNAPLRPLIFLLCLLTAGCQQKNTGVQRASDEGTVPLEVETYADQSVLVTVPVSINGKGPFRVTLDTGASYSMIEHSLVQELGLNVVGQNVQMTGISGASHADQIEVQDWSIGDVKLPPATIVSIDMPDASLKAGLRGFIGSDMLRKFGTVTIDYDNEQLRLGSLAE